MQRCVIHDMLHLVHERQGTGIPIAMAFALALDIIRLRLIKVRLWGTL